MDDLMAQVSRWRERNPFAAWRSSEGHSRSDLCVVLGTSDTTLGRLLRGEQKLTEEQIALLGLVDKSKAMLREYKIWWAERPAGVEE